MNISKKILPIMLVSLLFFAPSQIFAATYYCPNNVLVTCKTPCECTCDLETGPVTCAPGQSIACTTTNEGEIACQCAGSSLNPSCHQGDGVSRANIWMQVPPDLKPPEENVICPGYWERFFSRLGFARTPTLYDQSGNVLPPAPDTEEELWLNPQTNTCQPICEPCAAPCRVSHSEALANCESLSLGIEDEDGKKLYQECIDKMQDEVLECLQDDRHWDWCREQEPYEEAQECIRVKDYNIKGAFTEQSY